MTTPEFLCPTPLELAEFELADRTVDYAVADAASEIIAAIKLDEALLAVGLLSDKAGDHERWQQCRERTSSRMQHRFTPSKESNTDDPILATLRQKLDWTNLNAALCLITSLEDPKKQLDCYFDLAFVNMLKLDESFVEKAAACLEEQILVLNHKSSPLARAGFRQLYYKIDDKKRRMGTTENLQVFWGKMLRVMDLAIADQHLGAWRAIMTEEMGKDRHYRGAYDVPPNPYL